MKFFWILDGRLIMDENFGGFHQGDLIDEIYLGFGCRFIVEEFIFIFVGRCNG